MLPGAAFTWGLRLRGGAYLFESLRAGGKGKRSGQVRRSGCDSGSSHKASGEADERRPGSFGGREEAGLEQAGPSSGGESATPAPGGLSGAGVALIGEKSLSQPGGEMGCHLRGGSPRCRGYAAREVRRWGSNRRPKLWP